MKSGYIQLAVIAHRHPYDTTTNAIVGDPGVFLI
jgi:hypothetical protein